MLDRMVSNVLGLARTQVYIGNVVKCRPPQNRNPEESEVRSCLPFLHAQLRAVAPDFILVLGSVAVKALFGPGKGITALRGRWLSLDVGGRSVPVLPTFHPAYLLRQPDDKKLTFEDLKLLRAAMDARRGA
jgi:DNA polymerase